jgi:hypothetical protein
MPHFKCVACKGRLYGSVTMPDDACPGCGATLEPVGELSEIVGFRLLETHAGPAAGGARRLADRVAEMKARREAEQAGTGLDPALWLEDMGGGSAALSAPNPRSTRLET